MLNTNLTTATGGDLAVDQPAVRAARRTGATKLDRQIFAMNDDEISSAFNALSTHLSRKDRLSHPDGDFDKAKRWFPDSNEVCGCCESIRSPSRNWPYSLLVHCRSLQHCEMLFGACHADVLAVKNWAAKQGINTTALASMELPGFLSIRDSKRIQLRMTDEAGVPQTTSQLNQARRL